MARIKPEDRLKHIRDLKDQLDASQQREAELVADNARLREALEYALSAWQYDGICDEHGSVFAEADARCKATPAQSLAAITDPLNAHIQQLQVTLEEAAGWNWLDEDVPPNIVSLVENALSATPAQSLARLRNEVLEKEAVGEVEVIETDEDGEPSAWVRLYNDVELGELLYRATKELE